VVRTPEVKPKLAPVRKASRKLMSCSVPVPKGALRILA